MKNGIGQAQMSLQEMSHFEYEAEILQRLPTPLRKEVVLHIHRWETVNERKWTWVQAVDPGSNRDF